MFHTGDAVFAVERKVPASFCESAYSALFALTKAALLYAWPAVGATPPSAGFIAFDICWKSASNIPWCSACPHAPFGGASQRTLCAAYAPIGLIPAVALAHAAYCVAFIGVAPCGLLRMTRHSVCSPSVSGAVSVSTGLGTGS